ncbi:formate dehydrogenase subunit delta [Bosea sp. RAF48]
MEAGLSTEDTPGEPHDENIAKLRRMAGQIADFFKAYPEEEAAASVADHINQFWTGRMRGDFLAAFAARPEDLPPLLRHALPRIRPGRGG